MYQDQSVLMILASAHARSRGAISVIVWVRLSHFLQVEFIWVRLRQTYAGFDLLKSTIVETADEIFQHIIYHCKIALILVECL